MSSNSQPDHSFPPGWDELRRVSSSRQPREVLNDGFMTDAPRQAPRQQWGMYIMVEGRPDYFIPFDSSEEARQAEYELLEAMKDSREGTMDDPYSMYTIGPGSQNTSISIRIRSVMGTIITPIEPNAVRK